MKKVKMVALVHSSGDYAMFTDEFPSSARNIDILNMLYEVGKNVWFGNELYKVVTDSCGNRAYFRYEIVTVRKEN